MNDTIKAKAEQILYRLSTQTFDNFYKGPFEDYITGITGDTQKENILEEIAYIFRLEDEIKQNNNQCDENHCFCEQFDEDGEILCNLDLSTKES